MTRRKELPKPINQTQAISWEIGCPNCNHFDRQRYKKREVGILYCKLTTKPRVSQLIDSWSCQDFQNSTDSSNSSKPSNSSPFKV